MTKLEMREHLKTLGLSKDYRTTWDTENDERGVIRFLVRGKSGVFDGKFRGTQITLSGSRLEVWTSKTQKARAFCSAHGLRLRELNAEAVFTAKASTGDSFLIEWGARIRPIISEARKAGMRASLASSLQKAKECPKNTAAEAFR